MAISYIILYVVLLCITSFLITTYVYDHSRPKGHLTNSFLFTTSEFLNLREGTCDILIGSDIAAPEKASYLLIVHPNSKDEAETSRKMLENTLQINGSFMSDRCQKEYMEAIREDYVKTGNNRR